MKLVNLLFKDDAKLAYLDCTEELNPEKLINNTLEKPLTLTMPSTVPDVIPGYPEKAIVSGDGVRKREFKRANDPINYEYTFTEWIDSETVVKRDEIVNVGSYTCAIECDDSCRQTLSYVPNISNPSHAWFSCPLSTTYKSSLFCGIPPSFQWQTIANFVSQPYRFPINRNTSNSAGWNYLVRFTADRKAKLHGDVVYPFGYALLHVAGTLQPNKTYKVASTDKMLNYYRNLPSTSTEKLSWVAIEFCSFYQFGLSNYPATVPNSDTFNVMCVIEQGITRSSDDYKEVSHPMANLLNTLYKIKATQDVEQLKNFNTIFWSDQMKNTTKEQGIELLGLQNNIISLGFIPINMPGGARDEELTPIISEGKSTLKLGGIDISTVYPDTKVEMYDVRYQYPIYYSLRHLFSPKYGNYLDYSPYSKYLLTIPFCGTHEINPNVLYGRLIYLGYRIDLLTGDCCVSLWVSKNKITESDPTKWPDIGEQNYYVMNEFNGNCLVNAPISSGEFGVKQLYNIQALNSAYSQATTGLAGFASSLYNSKGIHGLVNSYLGTIGTQASLAELAGNVAAENRYNPTSSVRYGGAGIGSSGYLHDLRVKITYIGPSVSEPQITAYKKFFGMPTYKLMTGLNDAKLASGNKPFTAYVKEPSGSKPASVYSASYGIPQQDFEEIRLLFSKGVYIK